MAKYWIYIGNQVQGPFELEQLIRLPGFSRQSQVSPDDEGSAGKWISPAEIPDLARIFQKADELHAAPIPTPKPAPKPKPFPAKLTHVPPPVDEKRPFPWIWVGPTILLAV